MFSSKDVDTLLSDDGIQRYIPRLCRQHIDSLQFMCKADELGPSQVSTQSFVGKGAVVVSTTHTQAIALQIEADQWHEYQV